MNEKRKKLLKLYGYEWNHSRCAYIARATLGDLVIEHSVSVADIENLGEEYICKVLSSRIRKMKKSLAKQFLLTYDLYKMVKKEVGIEPAAINPHFITDNMIALDIFDSEYNHYVGLIDAHLKNPKLIYYGQKEDRSLDCISQTLRVLTKVFLSSNTGIEKYVKTDPNFKMR